ncbi:uncharacterized protein LOC131650982 [Vicia villosa]|uniref:uncharacterized protein LOC131650982 n=1 Tax=Vicia villosa TaxID=3911 RepID=UPI00273AA41A|nr:uncharacterized protein LOC131650982 [Vicia villosa]
MNLLSYNIRGGMSSKRKRVSYLIKSNNIDVCFIQETKLSGFNDYLAGAFWGSSDVEWTACNSVGAAGGMVILWRKGALTVNFSFVGKGFVGINILWKDKGYNLVNVYALCSVLERRLVWTSLLHKKQLIGQEEWCIVGDFNEVLRADERIGEGGSKHARGMEDFWGFVEDMDLVDVNCVGGNFTWFKDNGKAMSRLDSFLLSRNIVEEWEVIDQRIERRDISDHSPIRLNVGKIDWGPKNFRFNNAWFKHEGFMEFIKDEWGKLSFMGRGDYVLYAKLKALKEKLQVWNREVFVWIDLKMEEGWRLLMSWIG